MALATLPPLLVYLRTMAPTVYGLDSAELSTGAYLLGVVHSPGSPLFLLLGHLFTWLPWGDVGYRVNLLSACSGAAAAAFVYGAARLLTGQRLLALGTAWYLAWTYYFWISAVAAELYALHALVVAALLWLALRWRDRLDGRRLGLFAFLFGLGLGNHLSLIVLAPGYACLLASGRSQPWRQARWCLGAAACGLAGASIYLYLPLRADSPMNYARDFGIDVRTWGGFWSAVSGQMFASKFFAVPASHLLPELTTYLYRLWSNFLGVGCVLGTLGLVADFQRRQAVHLGLLLLFAGHLGFMLGYNVLDKEVMMLPTYLIWSLWAALGLQALGEHFGRSWDEPWSGLGAGTVMLALSAANLLVNFGYADVSRDWSARLSAETIHRGLPPNALFVGGWYDVPVLEYLTLVEGHRPDIETVNLFFVPKEKRGELLRRAREQGRPLFTSWPSALHRTGAVFVRDDACGCHRLISAPAGE